MRLAIVHAAFQSALCGAAAMNAFWHPSAITVGMMPLIGGLTALAVWRALEKAA